MGPGTVLGGKYRLLELIGEGAMGTVWSAKNELTERHFALKLLSAGRIGGDDASRRLLREARAAGQLSHRNVVEVYDVGTTDAGDPFLVMQLLRGESLESLIERAGRLGQKAAVEIAISIGRALVVAHAAGVVHRDLKPANVFLHQEADAGTVVKVVDFGVSKVLDGGVGSTESGVAIGTPAYMSPEQGRGDRSLDHRTDLWSLGVILFEMLSGKRPFRGETALALFANICVGAVPDLAREVPGTHPGLVAIVERCLERDVSRRFASAEELVTELDRVARALAKAPDAEQASLASTLDGLRAAPRAGSTPARSSATGVVRSSSGRTGSGARVLWVVAVGAALVSVAIGAALTKMRNPDDGTAPAANSVATSTVETANAPTTPAPSVASVQLHSEPTAESPAPSASTQPSPKRRMAPRKTGTPELPPASKGTVDGIPREPW